jgi:hypothetical protein
VSRFRRVEQATEAVTRAQRCVPKQRIDQGYENDKSDAPTTALRAAGRQCNIGHISERTVENHIRTILSNAGLRSRSELAMALADDGVT